MEACCAKASFLIPPEFLGKVIVLNWTDSYTRRVTGQKRRENSPTKKSRTESFQRSPINLVEESKLVSHENLALRLRGVSRNKILPYENFQDRTDCHTSDVLSDLQQGDRFVQKALSFVLVDRVRSNFLRPENEWQKRLVKPPKRSSNSLPRSASNFEQTDETDTVKVMNR